jgi:hypothetical protein
MPGAQPCGFEGCSNFAVPRGSYCGAHYKQRRKSGQLKELAPRKRTPLESFWDAVFDMLDLKTSDSAAWARAKRRVLMAGLRAWRRGNRVKL